MTYMRALACGKFKVTWTLYSDDFDCSLFLEELGY
ncbi:hypothetical protein SAMN06266787_10397 [Halorubrum ezzemoulense]|uniref:Uncharacterized protein n=1 Tax=Halorubrum ezzemoulense TaxID=337243 RepID=A0A238X3N4_HALEZ|nr:hypothetical protein SAMN06266787_10397 [Halorubrum ezzemoulense]